MKKIFKIFIWSGIAAFVLFFSLSIQPVSSESDNPLTLKNAEALAIVEPSANCSNDCTPCIWLICRYCPSSGSECFFVGEKANSGTDWVCYN